MKEQNLEVVKNVALNKSTYELLLKGENINMKSGQFVEVKLDNFYLRRPFSVASVEKDLLTLIYKVVGQGTKQMTKLKAGDTLSVLCELGKPFDLSVSKKPLLIGGGIGCVPLFQLAKEFNQKGIRPTILLGFRDESELFYIDKFKKLGEVIVATDDGSCGKCGNAVCVLEDLSIDFDCYYACGPMVMLSALSQFSTKGQLSLEARMACGFGACMGCTIMTTKGPQRVCKEGPIFWADEVVFEKAECSAGENK